MENQNINLIKGFIYKIQPNTPFDLGDIYIGSSINPINKRLCLHKSLYKRYKAGLGNKVKSYDLFDKYGVDKFDIILIEEIEFDNNNPIELKKREGHHIKTNRCVNHNVSGRTMKEYCADHGFKLNNRAKLWYKNNMERCNQKFICNCGGKYTNSQKSTHLKSMKHKRFELINV
jgi:hypothetical protein